MAKRRKTFHRGKWAIEKERHRLNDPVPASASGDPQSMEVLVSHLMKKLGLEQEHWVDVLQSDWVKIVGDAVGKHTKPGRIDGKKLVVFVDSSIWLNELSRYGRKEMLSNLQGKFGAARISSIVLQLDPDSGRGKNG